MAAKKLFRVALQGVKPLIIRAADKDEAWRRYKKEMGIIRSEWDPHFTEVTIPDWDPTGSKEVMEVPPEPKPLPTGHAHAGMVHAPA